MSKRKTITEDTIIDWTVPLEKYRAFFRKTIEDFSPEVFCGEFKSWLNGHTGKTLKDAVDDYRFHSREPRCMSEIMNEHRFNNISRADKTFILALDKEMMKLGYDFGGKIGSGFCWGRNMIVWSKVGVKSKQVAARVYIRDSGIVLRLFFNKVSAHQAYIENAPTHIKEVFVSGSSGDCCCPVTKSETCRMRKTYSIDGEAVAKCSGAVYEFYNPTLEKLPDYMGLLHEFYPVKNAKSKT